MKGLWLQDFGVAVRVFVVEAWRRCGFRVLKFTDPRGDFGILAIGEAWHRFC